MREPLSHRRAAVDFTRKTLKLLRRCTLLFLQPSDDLIIDVPVPLLIATVGLLVLRLSGPGPFRNWRRLGLREGARPRATFHFRYRFGYLPAFPRYEGKVVEHHLFPQAKEFQEWFRSSGIDVHQYTLVIPEHLHSRLHRGEGRGGLWNEPWRQLHQANPEAQSPEFLLRHAFKLAFRYKLVGPIIPYHRPVRPIGPQLYGD